jgi:hypothetical protein
VPRGCCLLLAVRVPHWLYGRMDGRSGCLGLALGILLF